MGKENFVKEITNIEENFAQWYTDVVRKAELADYTDTKGCIAIRPYGYAIWENIQNYADAKFKEVGVTNLYMPVLIPESMLEKEKDHVEGFAPEVAWVTMGGGEELEERLCIRPTSETMMSTMYAKWVKSWRDLPILGNQWCNVLRWEKETRPFLRSREFLWQEGHTIHETAKEAEERTLMMLEIYADVIENLLAIPVLKGQKTPKEQFAGAESTYTVETLMVDGRALQAGTSHYFGQNFTKPFEIKFQNRDGKEEYAYQTSWGISTRLIGAVIMAHGDNRGLKLPPRVAPIQAVLVPIAAHKEGVAVLVRRDTSEKITVKIEDLEKELETLLETIQKDMFDACVERKNQKTNVAYSLEEIEKALAENQGYVKTMWCGDRNCEDKVKEVTGAPSRCMPFEQEHLADTCAICGKKATKMVVWGRQY